VFIRNIWGGLLRVFYFLEEGHNTMGGSSICPDMSEKKGLGDNDSKKDRGEQKIE